MSNVALYFSGGSSNADPEASLGGAKSNTLATSALFGAFSNAEFAAGTVVYRCVYVVALTTLDAIKAWIVSETPSAATSIALGWVTPSPGVNVAAQLIANERQTPVNVIFGSPFDSASAPSSGNYLATEYRPLWLRYTITTTAPIAYELFSIEVDGTVVGGGGGGGESLDFSIDANSQYKALGII